MSSATGSSADPGSPTAPSYPLTRRFWLTSLGRPFGGDLRLVAPDLRAVVGAVAQGMGMSLLPSFVCTDALRTGSIVEVHPVAEVAPVEPWFACIRSADQSWDQLVQLVSRLAIERDD